jgi:hypothetical protein
LDVRFLSTGISADYLKIVTSINPHVACAGWEKNTISSAQVDFVPIRPADQQLGVAFADA